MYGRWPWKFQSATADLLEEPDRLRGRLNAQLRSQFLPVRFKDSQCLTLAAGPDQQAHQLPLALFLPGLQLDPAPGIGQGYFRGAVVFVDGGKSV